jgi:hypothetical protein
VLNDAFLATSIGRSHFAGTPLQLLKVSDREYFVRLWQTFLKIAEIWINGVIVCGA